MDGAAEMWFNQLHYYNDTPDLICNSHGADKSGNSHQLKPCSYSIYLFPLVWMSVSMNKMCTFSDWLWQREPTGREDKSEGDRQRATFRNSSKTLLANKKLINSSRWVTTEEKQHVNHGLDEKLVSQGWKNRRYIPSYLKTCMQWVGLQGRLDVDAEYIIVNCYFDLQSYVEQKANEGGTSRASVSGQTSNCRRRQGRRGGSGAGKALHLQGGYRGGGLPGIHSHWTPV